MVVIVEDDVNKKKRRERRKGAPVFRLFEAKKVKATGREVIQNFVPFLDPLWITVL